MSWRDLPQAADQLREAGLAVISVHNTSWNPTSQVVYIRWDHIPERYEREMADHYLRVQDPRHIGPHITPPGCPWA